MKKILLVLMSLLVLFTRCKKNDEEFVDDSNTLVPVRLEIPLNGSRTSFSSLFPNGEIKWGNKNKVECIYLATPRAYSYYSMKEEKLKYLGLLFEMRADVEEYTDKIVFYGQVYKGSMVNLEYCTAYYFGNNGDAPQGSNVTDITTKMVDIHLTGKKISFDKQTGNIDDLGDYHLAKANVKVYKRKTVNNLYLYDLEMESFTTMNSIAMLDLKGETKLEGSAAKVKSYTIEWMVEENVFRETYEYDTLGYIDVSNNVGDRSFISLLPTEDSVSLECGKGRYDFYKGISSNKVYVGKYGNTLDDLMPLEWSTP